MPTWAARRGRAVGELAKHKDAAAQQHAELGAKGIEAQASKIEVQESSIEALES